MRRSRAREGGFTLVELLSAITIISVLSAIALPAYVKYVRRAATAEAGINLRIMYDGAVAYYVGERADSAGVLRPRMFPTSVGPTPAAIPAATRVQVPPAAWAVPGWVALNFAIGDPVRFSYSFSSNGLSNTAAVANMIAQGDLDGDGIPSTFKRTCKGVTEGVSGGAALYMVNETE